MILSIISISLRTFLALGILLVLARIMGRRSVAQLTLYDYVLGLIFGNIGASFAVDRSIEIADGLISLLACTVWILVVNFLMLKSEWARKLVDPEPAMVIYNGCILEGNLRKNYYWINSLLELLREREVFDPGTVALAVVESDGELSIIKKKEGKEAKDTPQQESVPDMRDFALHLSGRALIIDGKIMDRVFEHGGANKEWLLNNLEDRNLKPEDVMVALITPEGHLYVDKKEDNISFEV